MQAAAAFMICRTQFQFAPSGTPTGLRYADCLAMLQLHAKMLGVRRGGMGELFELVQVIERAFVQGVREACAREHPPRDN